MVVLVGWERVDVPSCGDLSDLSGSGLYLQHPPGQELYQLPALRATRSSSVVVLGTEELGGVGVAWREGDLQRYS